MGWLKGSAAMLGSRGGIVGFAFVNSVVTARLLRPDGRGRYALLMAGLSMCLLIFGPVGNAVALSAAHDDRSASERTISNSLVLAGAFGVMPVIALFFWRPGPEWTPSLLIGAIGVTFGLASLFTQYACQGYGCLGWLAFLQLFRVALAAILGVAMIGVAHMGLTGAAAGWTGSQLCTLVISFVPLRNIGWRPRLTDLAPSQYGRLLSFGATSTVPGVLSFLANRASLFVVEAQLGIAAVGVYSIAYTVAEPVSSISAGLSAAAYPSLIPRDNRLDVLRRFVTLSFIGSVLASAVALLFGWVLIGPVFGSSYLDARAVLPWLLIAYVAASGRDTVVYYFMHQDRTVTRAIKASFAGLLVAGVLGWPLVSWLGIPGAAISVMFAKAVEVTYLLFGVRAAGYSWTWYFLPRRRDLRAGIRSIRSAGAKRRESG